MAVAAEIEPERSNSQTVRAQLAVRDLVLTGALKAGEHVSELSLVGRVGVSRTPVRAALHRLAEEGLLEPRAAGGFTVKAFSDRDVLDSIEIRGVLEGLAARLAAERGVSLTAIAPLRRCLAELDEVVRQTGRSVEIFSDYVALNARFHAVLVGLADSRPLERQIERAVNLPFASPSAFVMVQSTMPEARTILTIAQDHHRCVLDAIEQREGARAESLMREHSRLASRNLALALRNQETLDLVPGAALIRSSSIA
ncbi:MAG: GntR family transcriptional regulator [Alphaproteobacteria bacterium]|nr:GntR family transcriptional regulator [Alphaproteobacteria bacterium]